VTVLLRISTSRLFKASPEKPGPVSEKILAPNASAGPAPCLAGNRAACQLTLPPQSETVGLAKGLLSLATGAQAQTALQGVQVAQASQPPADDLYSQPVRRPPRRVPIYPRYQAEPEDVYPRYYPGPNAVRVCTATYVQEFRPSGTVIVPHMTCVWRRG
jgi:hypothetical protein